MIRVRYFNSFDKSLEDLLPKDRNRAIKGVNQLLDYFSGGPRPLGLGLRKLQGNFWEIRATLDKRVLFLLEKDVVSFVIAGNHDEIRRYLR